MHINFNFVAVELEEFANNFFAQQRLLTLAQTVVCLINLESCNKRLVHRQLQVCTQVATSLKQQKKSVMIRHAVKIPKTH